MSQSEQTSKSEKATLSDLFRRCEAAYQNADDREMQNAVTQLFDFISQQEIDKPAAKSIELSAEAEALLERQDWEAALQAYMSACDHAQNLDSPGMEYKAYSDLSQFYTFVGDHELAVTASLSSLEAARRCGNEIVVLMALYNYSACLLSAGLISEALPFCDEMVTSCSSKGLKGLSVARALTMRARCYAMLGAITQAERDLQAAWPHLEPARGMHVAAGLQACLASWWETRARLKAAKEEYDEAVEAWQNAVEHRRLVCAAPQITGPFKIARLANTLSDLGKALSVIDDTEGAAAALSECDTLRRQIHQPV